MRAKWQARVFILTLILFSWTALIVFSLKPEGSVNYLKTYFKLIAQSFYNPDSRPLCDFESQSDLYDWHTSRAALSISREYAAGGKSSCMVKFYEFFNIEEDKGGFPSMRLENNILGPAEERNWLRHDFFKADFYKPLDTDINLTIKIKDARSRVFEDVITLKAVEKTAFTADFDEMGEVIDLKNIVYIGFFVRHLEQEAVFFIDNIRIEKKGNPAYPDRRLDKPFLEFVSLQAPETMKLNEAKNVSFSMRALKPIRKKYRLFIHFFPMDSTEEKFSRRLGYINMDMQPPVPTDEWEPEKTYRIGPLELYMPYNNPTGEYGIAIGLYNDSQPGSDKAKFEKMNRGAVDFTGTYPKLRYVNKGIGKDYIVGKIKVER